MTYAIDAVGNRLPRSSRYLWAAVGVLGTATLAMGAALVQVQTPPVAMAAPENLSTPTSVVARLAADTVAAPAPAVAPVHKQKVPQAPVNTAQAAMKSVAKEGAKTVHSPAPKGLPQPNSTPWDGAVGAAESMDVPRVVAQAPKVLCNHCGTVESVEPIQHETTPTGVGAIAGAVLGGLVGNQFGGGDGKAVATVIGAMGGGWAGNTVEKRMKKELAYRVDVRMEDGSLRTVEQNSPLAVGSQVTVEGNVVRPASPVGARDTI
ncbi:MAG: glycine zipper 2TM domain-containing protein [Rhodoferax sp.]|nr:glycine zipper 2TM domain-containing protein [Rhodoferax sp.]MDP3650428.1 glycine zipper 2TM domain-containing protein [Rhodoferax sp.]